VSILSAQIEFLHTQVPRIGQDAGTPTLDDANDFVTLVLTVFERLVKRGQHQREEKGAGWGEEDARKFATLWKATHLLVSEGRERIRGLKVDRFDEFMDALGELRLIADHHGDIIESVSAMERGERGIPLGEAMSAVRSRTQS
jgi:hypothetical protein